MTYPTHIELKRHHRQGDDVWACAFALTQDRTKILRRRKPQRGLLTGDEKTARGFVPYSPVTGMPMWSKTVKLPGLMFADSEAETIALYNEKIYEHIGFGTAWDGLLREELLPGPDGPERHIETDGRDQS